MSLRSQLIRRWWHRMLKRFPHRRIEWLAHRPLPAGVQLLQRHPQLETLERRELLVADPMSMYGSSWEAPDYMTSPYQSYQSTLDSSDFWMGASPDMYAMPGSSGDPSSYPSSYPQDPGLLQDPGGLHDPGTMDGFAGWESEAWWMMGTSGPSDPAMDPGTSTTQPGSLSGSGSSSPATGTNHATSGFPDPMVSSESTSSSQQTNWEVVELDYDRTGGGVSSYHSMDVFGTAVLTGRVARNRTATQDSTLPAESVNQAAHHVAIEWEGEVPGEVAHRTWVQPGGSFVRTLDQLGYGQQTVRYRVVSWDFPSATASADASEETASELPAESDFESAGKQVGDWQSFTFLHLAAPAPEVVELRIADYRPVGIGDGTAAGAATGAINSMLDTNPFGTPLSAPPTGRMVEGLVRDQDGTPVPYAAVFLEIHGQQLVLTRTTADAGGRFRYLLSDLKDNSEDDQDSVNLTVKARSSRWDSSAQAEVHGHWTTAQHDPSSAELDPASEAGVDSGSELPESELTGLEESGSEVTGAVEALFDSPELSFQRLLLEINGSPAIHQAFQLQLRQAQQQGHQAAHGLVGQPDLGGAELAHRQRLEEAWGEYQDRLRELAEWLKAEQLDAHRVHTTQVALAEQEYRDRVNSTSMPDMSGAATMEEMMILYHQHRQQQEEQAQIQRADRLAEARREMLHRVASAQREFSEQQALAEQTWTLAQATSERELISVRADWTRWMQERRILASQTLREGAAEAVLQAAQQQADFHLQQWQLLLEEHPSSEAATELGMQQHHFAQEVAAEAARVARSWIELEVTNALAFVATQHGEMQTHAVAQLAYRTARAEADRALKQGLAEDRYLADIERAEAEFDYLRAAIPLQAAQQVHFTPVRAEQLSELLNQWEISKAEIRHQETHNRVTRHETWSQVDLQAYVDYRHVIHRLEQSRAVSLSELQARADKVRGELDASYFQTHAAARAEQARAWSLVLTSLRVAQVEQEARTVSDRLPPDLGHLDRTRIEMEAARLVQRVASEAAAIDQAVSQQVQHELTWAADVASAYRQSARLTSAATHAHNLAMSLNQLARADQQLSVETAYRGATRNAHWSHQRAIADIELQEVRGEITSQEAAQQMADAAREKRQREADAFVSRTDTLAVADVQFTQQAAAANQQRVHGWTSAAESEAQATHDVERRLSESNLSTWRMTADNLDHTRAEFDRQHLLAELQWLLGTSAAKRQQENEDHQRLRQDLHAAWIDSSDAPIPPEGFLFASGDNSLGSLSPSDPDLTGDPQSRLRLYPETTAELEETGTLSWRNDLQSELEQVLSDLAGHDDQWLERLAGILQSGLESSRKAQLEYLNRLTDAVVSRATSQRANQADMQIRNWNAESEFHRQSLAANGTATRETTAAEGQYQIAVATARANWLAIMARGVAQLHVAGQTPPADGDPSSTWTEAQQQYQAISQQAEQAWQAQLQSARIQRAERIGEAGVQRARQVGAAGVELAEERGQASLLFAQVNKGLETVYAIAMSEAERRWVEAMATMMADGDIAMARAIADLQNSVSVSQKESLQRLIMAKQGLLNQLARADEWNWLASGWGEPWGSGDVSLEDELRQAASRLLPYQFDLVTLDDRHALDLAQARIERVVDWGEVDIGFAQASGAARKSFAREASGAVRKFQMSVLNADQHMLTHAAYHDQTRSRARATSEAQWELDAAVAFKQYLVATAGASASEQVDSQARQWEVAMANANAEHQIRLAQLEHRWTTDMISAEEFHTRFVLAAQSLMERELVAARRAMHGELASANMNQYRAKGAIEAAWLNQIVTLGTRWQRAVSEVLVDLRMAEWSEGMRLEPFLGLGSTTGQVGTSGETGTAGPTAEMLHGWQTGAWELYRDWIDQRGVIQRAGFQKWGAAFTHAVDRVTAVDYEYTQSYLSAESNRRLAEIQAWDTYAQYMVSPARQLDQALADAERDWTIAQVEAERQRILSGNSATKQVAISNALAARQNQIELARQHYLQAEQVAASSRDQQWLGAAENFDNVVAQAGNVWRQARNDAHLDWNEKATQLQSSLVNSLQQEDERYAGRLASLWQTEVGSGPFDMNALPRHAGLEIPGIWGQLLGRESLRHAHAFNWSTWTWGETMEGNGIRASSASSAIGPSWTEPWSSTAGAFAQVAAPSHLSAAMANDDILQSGDAQQILESIHPTSYGQGILMESGMPDPSQWAQLSGMDFSRFGEEGTNPLGAMLGGPVESGEGHHSPYAIHGVGFQAGSGTSSQPILAAHASNLARADQSGWSGFFRDLSLMTQHPLATLKGAAGGLVTSGKVLVNGTLTTLKSTATLGMASSPVEVLQVSEVDRANGYDTSFAIMRTSQELLVGVTTGKLAAMKYPGRLGQIATGAYYLDAAQNATSTVRGGYGVAFGEGWTFQNSLNLAGGVMGLSGNVVGRVSPTQRAPHSYSPEMLSQPQIGLGVNLDGKMDPIGHAFITFDRPLGETLAHGFYPRDGFDLLSPEHLKRLLGSQGGLVAAVIPEKTELVQSAGTLIQRYRVTEAQFQQARRLVEQIQEDARSGLVRYHAASQCATFARQVLKEAGVKTFIPVPYPPLMYATLWLKKTLG